MNDDDRLGWSRDTSGWAVPTPPPAAPAPAPGPARRSDPPGAGLMAAVIALVLAVGVGAVARRAAPPLATPRTALTAPLTSVPPSSAAPVVDRVDDAVVNIDATLGYQGSRAAGTGMILTPTGRVLTNNHVIEGATRITASVSTTGRSYVATVVGSAPAQDIAVLQLEGASDLTTVAVSSAALRIGDPVTALGNAGGGGGTAVVATGRIVALGQTITATDDRGANARRLSDLIQFSAPIESGDSGGPLANSAGEVIGINTAAAVTGPRSQLTTTSGYAIPIARALALAGQIESGVKAEGIRIGVPAFLGVQVSPTGAPGRPGALVAGILPGTPAAAAGISAGDAIVSVAGDPVASAPGLTAALSAYEPGDRVRVGWTTPGGSTLSAQVTLARGPAA